MVICFGKSKPEDHTNDSPIGTLKQIECYGGQLEKAGLLERTGTSLELAAESEAEAIKCSGSTMGKRKVSRPYRYEVYQVGSKYFSWRYIQCL